MAAVTDIELVAVNIVAVAVMEAVTAVVNTTAAVVV